MKLTRMNAMVALDAYRTFGNTRVEFVSPMSARGVLQSESKEDTFEKVKQWVEKTSRAADGSDFVWPTRSLSHLLCRNHVLIHASQETRTSRCL